MYVYGFRDLQVNVPLAKQLQQKHMSVVSFTPQKSANAKIKGFLFLFFFLESLVISELLDILISVYK